MLAEAKVQAVHHLVRSFAEYAPKIAKSTHLEIRPGATLQSAQDLDRETGRYEESARHYFSVFQDLKHHFNAPEILFLEADDETLVRRFSETRRKHPLH